MLGSDSGSDRVRVEFELVQVEFSFGLSSSMVRFKFV